MRNYLIILGLFVCFMAKAQYTQLIKVDTLKGADTIYFMTPELKRTNSFVSLKAHCKNVGGTSDGYIIARASDESRNFANLISTDFLVYGFPNDTLTITDGVTGLWAILGLPFNYFDLMAVGTVGDTTEIKATYLTKKY